MYHFNQIQFHLDSRTRAVVAMGGTLAGVALAATRVGIEGNCRPHLRLRGSLKPSRCRHCSFMFLVINLLVEMEPVRPVSELRALCITSAAL